VQRGAPPVTDADRWLLRAFWDLTSSRQYGQAIGGIPWRDIVAYGERSGLDGDVLSMFVRVIRSLDGEYLRWEAEEAKKRASAPASSGPSVAPRGAPPARGKGRSRV